MNDKIQTIFNSEKDINSNAEDFYRNYWTETGGVKKETRLKNSSIIYRFFPQGLSGKKILEIGVGGEGGVLLELMQHNEVHGMDVSDSAIHNCRSFGISVTKANLDCDSIPFQDNYFDAVFAFEVFEHFSNPQHAVEEIRRVTKPGGAFICSIPATYTYHWPRIFYAGLFEKNNFEDFLMANDLKVSCCNDWMINNRYGRYKITSDITSWSWYYYSEKLGSADARGYFDAGMHFWKKRNELGIRTRPIEAIDLFRKCLKIAPEDTDAKLYLTHALVYRAINGDHEEFFKNVDVIIAHLMAPSGGNKLEYLVRLLLIHIEANRLGLILLDPEDYHKMKSQISQMDGTKDLLEEIYREEAISQQLASCQL